MKVSPALLPVPLTVIVLPFTSLDAKVTSTPCAKVIALMSKIVTAELPAVFVVKSVSAVTKIVSVDGVSALDPLVPPAKTSDATYDVPLTTKVSAPVPPYVLDGYPFKLQKKVPLAF